MVDASCPGHRAARLAVGALLLVSACGSGSASTPSGDAADGAAPTDDGGVPEDLTCAPQSGSRLRQLVRQHDDGTSVGVGIHDAFRGVACSFEPTTDGTLVCVPETGLYFALARYTDPECRTMVAELTPGVDPPTVARVLHDDGSACTNEEVFYALGEPIVVVPGVTPIYVENGTTCAATTSSGSSYHAVLGPADLVSARPTWVGGRLSIRQLDGEDGSRWCDVHGALRDAELEGSPCTLSYGEGLAVRCFPETRNRQTLFSDAACGVEVQVAVPSLCERAARFVQGPRDPCGGVAMHELGAPAGPLYERSFANGESCQPASGDLTDATLIGATVTDASFALMTRRYVPLGGRLERGDLAGPGLRLFRSQLRDAELDLPCDFEVASDGLLRCLPSTGAPDDVVAEITDGFADAACTVPRSVATVTSGCGRPPPRVAAAPSRIHRIGAPSTAALYVLGEACAPLEGSDAYELGEELAAEMFVSGVVAPE